VARLDFANARIGARRSRLLGTAGIRDLLGRATLEARLELVQRSWGRTVTADLARAPDPLGAIEAALGAALRREAIGILAVVEGAAARRLLAAYLELDAARAVKAILRGVAAGAPLDRIVAVAPPTPELDVEAIRSLAAEPTVEAVAAALEASGSALAPRLRAALPERTRYGLLPLEVAVDRAAAERALRAARARREDARLLRAHLRDRIDARNAETLLALGGHPVPPDEPGAAAPAAHARAEELFVPGGRRLDEAAFVRLAAAEGPGLRAGLDALFPGSDAALARPWSADRALERSLLAPLRREARARPLSLAVPLLYLSERRAEARRVAVVLRGAGLGLPGDEILDLAEA
jgi:V/A-type H+-transporting ATPase subunit C